MFEKITYTIIIIKKAFQFISDLFDCATVTASAENL